MEDDSINLEAVAKRARQGDGTSRETDSLKKSRLEFNGSAGWRRRLMQWRLGMGGFAPESVSSDTMTSVNVTSFRVDDDGPTEGLQTLASPQKARDVFGEAKNIEIPSAISMVPSTEILDDIDDGPVGNDSFDGGYDEGGFGNEDEVDDDEKESEPRRPLFVDSPPRFSDTRTVKKVSRTERAESEAEPEAESAVESGAEARNTLESDEEKMRPREPLEIQKPRIYEVDVDDLPELDFSDGGSVNSEDLQSEGSDDEDLGSDSGSIYDMIVKDEDDESEDLDYVETSDAAGGIDASDSSNSDDESDIEDSVDEEWTPGEETLALINQAPQSETHGEKRHRVPALRYWLNERIEYDMGNDLALPTATSVVLVEEPKPIRRRRRRRRPKPAPVNLDDMDEHEQRDIQAPVYDSERHRSQSETVAKSIRGMPFEKLPDNPKVQVVVLFDPPRGVPVESLVMKIQPRGKVKYDDVQNRAVTFVIWSGRCEVSINGKSFELTRGMACKVPRGNDLALSNPASSDVFLLVTEINDIDTNLVEESENVSVGPEEASVWSGGNFTAGSLNRTGAWREMFH